MDKNAVPQNDYERRQRYYSSRRVSLLTGCIKRVRLVGAWRLPAFGQAMSDNLAPHGTRSNGSSAGNFATH
ncbi:MAG: hypothetical protein EBU40_05705 [Proteobacteria bacterium]|nr:hypothetical protein [Pseudomonadota bacterium]NBT95999.1 hypothetical protein [Chloroflexota bacterium]NDE08294.1 hypothetical protein [Chloroflexota bacterium]